MSKSILIVEDEDLIRSACADAFVDANYVVVAVASGDEALALLHAGEQVDAVVSDIQMPGTVDGVTLRREVEIRWPDISMVMTSGHLQLERSELSENQIFVAKPYEYASLVQKVDELLT